MATERFDEMTSEMVKQRPFSGGLNVRFRIVGTAQVLCCMLVGSPAYAADLLGFCTAARPADALGDLFDQHCPGFLAQQFAAATSAMTAADLAQAQAKISTETAQQQAEATLTKTYADMVKAGPPVVPAGTDVSALASKAAMEEGQLTFDIASQVAVEVLTAVPEDAVVLVLEPTELRSFFESRTDSAAVLAILQDLTKRVSAAGKACKPAKVGFTPVAAVIGAQAILSGVSTVAAMFQPALLAVSGTKGIDTPGPLLAAGLASGAGLHRKRFLFYLPANETNKVIEGLAALSKAATDAEQTLANCDPKDLKLLEARATLQSVRDRINSLQQAEAGKLSAIDVAARRAALDENKVSHILAVSRDVRAGGAAIVKPSAFHAGRLMMSSAVGISFQLFDRKGSSLLSGYIPKLRGDNVPISEWNPSN